MNAEIADPEARGDHNREVDDDGRPRRTGTVWTASAHIITAIVGSGVLSLAWGMAQLGWIAGTATIVIFSAITLYTSGLLADCYRDPVSGKRNHTYREAAKNYLGGRKEKACAWVQYGFLSVMLIGYTITASISLVSIRKSSCLRKGGDKASCRFSNNPFMIGLGVTEILLSQIPNFHKLSWLSVIAAIMSFSYAGIGMGLSFARVVSGQIKETSLTGVGVGPVFSAADKTWNILTAIGDMAFACAYSAIVIEIQDTLKSSPPENKTMKKANAIGTLTATGLNLLCGCLGYAALGNLTPGNLLSGGGFSEPFWLVDVANVFIVVHLLGAYQVIAQPVFSVIETWARIKWPKSNFIIKEYPLAIPNNNNLGFNFNLFRLTFRTSVVILATFISMAFPFFNEVLALLGAITYWPLTVYFPLEMYIARTNMKKLSLKWIMLMALNFTCLITALAVASSSFQGLSQALHKYKPFEFKGQLMRKLQ